MLKPCRFTALELGFARVIVRLRALGCLAVSDAFVVAQFGLQRPSRDHSIAMPSEVDKREFSRVVRERGGGQCAIA
jgi:hypothetical protein